VAQKKSIERKIALFFKWLIVLPIVFMIVKTSGLIDTSSIMKSAPPQGVAVSKSAPVSQLDREPLRCDKFVANAKLDGDTLSVSLDSDCPPGSEIMVSVYRVYYDKQDGKAYNYNYFEEQSTVRAWSTPRQISVAHKPWLAGLKVLQDKLARMGEPLTVQRINDEIEVSFVLPVNQSDARFGKKNEHLTGSAVITTNYGLRICESEVVIPYPIGSKPAPSRFVAAHSLVAGKTYRISRETPLVGNPDPSDPIAEIKKIRRLAPSSWIKVVLLSYFDKVLWYKVETAEGRGWINSIALIGQDIERAGDGITKPDARLVREVQSYLKDLGYNISAVDGQPGPKTRAAVRAFQSDVGLTVTGNIDGLLLKELRNR